jgi:hypothetical protein
MPDSDNDHRVFANARARTRVNGDRPGSEAFPYSFFNKRPAAMMHQDAVTLIGISGSPRIASTAYAVEAALQYAADQYGFETDYLSLHNKKLNFCIHCDYCLKKKGCVHKDFWTGSGHPLQEIRKSLPTRWAQE